MAAQSGPSDAFLHFDGASTGQGVLDLQALSGSFTSLISHVRHVLGECPFSYAFGDPNPDDQIGQALWTNVKPLLDQLLAILAAFEAALGGAGHTLGLAGHALTTANEGAADAASGGRR